MAEEKKGKKPEDAQEKKAGKGRAAEAKGPRADSAKEAPSGKDEKIEIVDEPKKKAKGDGYSPKQKPEGLGSEIARQMEIRGQIKDRRPTFRRQEGHRYKRLETGWRKPRGSHSKMRRHYKYRGRVVSIGYGGPAAVRHLHPSGFQEVLVYNPKQLEAVKPELQAVRIAHTVGIRKRFEIEKKAGELSIRVLNSS